MITFTAWVPEVGNRRSQKASTWTQDIHSKLDLTKITSNSNSCVKGEFQWTAGASSEDVCELIPQFMANRLTCKLHCLPSSVCMAGMESRISWGWAKATQTMELMATQGLIQAIVLKRPSTSLLSRRSVGIFKRKKCFSANVLKCRLGVSYVSRLPAIYNT